MAPSKAKRAKKSAKKRPKIATGPLVNQSEARSRRDYCADETIEAAARRAWLVKVRADIPVDNASEPDPNLSDTMYGLHQVVLGCSADIRTLQRDGEERSARLLGALGNLAGAMQGLIETHRLQCKRVDLLIARVDELLTL